MFDIEIALREERVDNCIDNLELYYINNNSPLIPAFDKAYKLVRRDRAEIAPKECLTTRLIVGKFLEQLESLLDTE